MPWLRVSDNALWHPRLLRVITPDDESTLLAEALGFLVAGATLSAAHMTDYVVEYGSWVMAAGGNMARASWLLERLEAAELVKKITIDGNQAWEIWQDDDFLHMRSKEEVEIDRQRKRDVRNPDVSIAARIRDGDQCRYCGRTVSWSDRKSARSATYDHIDGVEGDATVDDVVVCCRGCNTSLKPKGGQEKRALLRPVPQKPYFTESSVNFINSSQWARDRHVRVVKSSIRPPDPAKGGVGTPSHRVVGLCDPVETGGIVSGGDGEQPECTGRSANPVPEHSTGDAASHGVEDPHGESRAGGAVSREIVVSHECTGRRATSVSEHSAVQDVTSQGLATPSDWSLSTGGEEAVAGTSPSVDGDTASRRRRRRRRGRGR